MTDRPIQDLTALLNEPGSVEADDAVRRAELADILLAALAVAEPQDGGLGPDAAVLAAHLDGGLPEADRQDLMSRLARTPAALAELEASAALLEAVAAAPLRMPVEQAAKARAVLAAAQPERPSRWRAGFKAVSPLQLGFSLAALAAAAVVVVVSPSHLSTPANPTTSEATQGRVSAFAPSRTDKADAPAPVSAPVPKPSSSAWRGSILATGQASHGWAAVALSTPDHIYGAATGRPTRLEAEAFALATCVKQGGKTCGSLVSVQDQCLSVAAAADSSTQTAQAADRTGAEQQALKTCGPGVCATVITVCPAP